MNISRTLLMAGLMVMTSHAAAEYDTGIFFGGSAGYVNLGDSLGASGTQLAQPGFAGTATIDDNDLGWKAYFGYSLNQYFGVEVGYNDLGETKVDINRTAPTAQTQRATNGITGFNVSAVMRWPVIDRLELMAKFGGFFWDQDFKSAITDAAANTTHTRFDDDGTDIVAGIGFTYKMTDHVGLRAEWDRYVDVSDRQTDVDMFSMGLEFRY